MAEVEKSAAEKKQDKTGRKGGTLFPKLNLKQSLVYSKKLVAKTHTGPQPEKTILPGVFGNAGGPGKIRASALKQFGLLEGPATAYKATQLAKDIDASLVEDSLPLLRSSFLKSKLFNEIFQTFHGDTVSKAKIEQRAKGLSVHPESALECAQIFIESAITAGIGKLEGDSLSLLSSSVAALPSESTSSDPLEESTEEQEDLSNADAIDETAVKSTKDNEPNSTNRQQTKPGVTLNLTVDPSSDPDKLEKQLKLLRQFGVI